MQALLGPDRMAQRAVAACAVAGFVVLVGWFVQRAVGPLPQRAPVEAFPGRLLWPGPVVGLQVVAHSNHPLDQAAKLAVRDALLPLIQRLYREAPEAARRSPSAWRHYVERHREELAVAARRAVDHGPWPPWPVRVEAGPMTLAASSWRGSGSAPPVDAYLTVRVVIGAGRGHNWWCVAFPLLCPAPRPDPPRAAAAEPSRGQGEPPPAADPSGADGRDAGPAEASGHPRESSLSHRHPEPWWWRWWPGHWF